MASRRRAWRCGSTPPCSRWGSELGSSHSPALSRPTARQRRRRAAGARRRLPAAAYTKRAPWPAWASAPKSCRRQRLTRAACQRDFGVTVALPRGMGRPNAKPSARCALDHSAIRPAPSFWQSGGSGYAHLSDRRRYGPWSGGPLGCFGAAVGVSGCRSTRLWSFSEVFQSAPHAASS